MFQQRLLVGEKCPNLSLSKNNFGEKFHAALDSREPQLHPRIDFILE